MSDWEWKVGALNGYGEAGWQQKLGKIRRITVIVPKPTGGAFLMSPGSLQFMDGQKDLIEFDAEGLVTTCKIPTEGFIKDLERHWNRSAVVQAAAGDMPRGPRIIT